MAVYAEIDNLTKKFGDLIALERISICFESGKIHGIIGRNGSGKTVLLKCICGLMKADKGEIRIKEKAVICGQKQEAGIIIEVPGFIDHKSGIRNLKYLYELNHKKDMEHLKKVLIMVGLDPDMKKPVGKYSLGMKQRLALAQAIMEDPPLLIFDEPMNGLDNEGVADIRKVLADLREKGKTIILASHNREDIETLCDTVTEMDHGKIIRRIE